MYLKKWEDIPINLQNDEVKKYYEILEKRKIQLILKRILDLFFAIILLILLSPVMLILAIAIKMDSKGTVFYKQKRVTQYGKIFEIYKFRTMVSNADKMGSLVTIGNDNRITRVGHLIRKIRLDEIPQLVNVLKGEMSFVGTRPEVMKYVDKYSNEMKATLLMPAGITSLASIMFKDEDLIIENELKKGKNIDDVYINILLPKKMKYNLEYIKKFNFFYDLILEIKTIVKVGL